MYLLRAFLVRELLLCPGVQCVSTTQRINIDIDQVDASDTSELLRPSYRYKNIDLLGTNP